jgi:transposase-like protein
MAQRRQFPGNFKAKVAIEAIKGEKTINGIASIYEVHPNQVSKWKKRALELLQEVIDYRPGKKLLLTTMRKSFISKSAD